ncbi:STAS domain-containing protein [Amycolatopsis magusensis]|uniref:STAS domain-containing protein n=1 Tax=Amycolatopsis magusensis TaxID=882444 RepID=UPI0037BBF01B
MNDHNLGLEFDPPSTGPAVLRVIGELDHHTAPRLREALDSVSLSPGDGYVLDLSRLEYCDSTGVTVLVTALRKAEAAEGRLCLAGLSRELTRVFRLIGLGDVFSLHDTVEQAIECQRS